MESVKFLAEPTADPNIGKVADPAQVWRILVKSLGKQIRAGSAFLSCISGSRGFYSAHLGEIHLFHQAVHPTFTDGYAIITREIDPYLTRPQAFIRLGIDIQDFPFDFHVFLLPAGGLTIDILVISTPVDVQNPAKDGNEMLSGQCLDGL